MPGARAPNTVATMPTTIPSGIPLRELLEHRRLSHRDRRLAHVIGILRTRADSHEPAPSSLLQAIADFSRERSTVSRRLREIESGVDEASAPDVLEHA